MTLDELINALSVIDGYITAAIINANGKVLFADTSLSELDLSILNENLNHIFHPNQEKPKNGVTKSIVTTANSLNLIACLGSDAPVHLHFIVMLELDGNLAAMKIALEKVIDKTLEMLA